MDKLDILIKNKIVKYASRSNSDTTTNTEMLNEMSRLNKEWNWIVRVELYKSLDLISVCPIYYREINSKHGKLVKRLVIKPGTRQFSYINATICEFLKYSWPNLKSIVLDTKYNPKAMLHCLKLLEPVYSQLEQIKLVDGGNSQGLFSLIESISSKVELQLVNTFDTDTSTDNILTTISNPNNENKLRVCRLNRLVLTNNHFQTLAMKLCTQRLYLDRIALALDGKSTKTTISKKTTNQQSQLQVLHLSELHNMDSAFVMQISHNKFPKLECLEISTRGAFPHDGHFFDDMFADSWPTLKILRLPTINDKLAGNIAAHCPNLVELIVCANGGNMYKQLDFSESGLALIHKLPKLRVFKVVSRNFTKI